MLSRSLFGKLTAIVPIAMLLFWIAVAIVHTAFAAAVFRHASVRRDGGGRLAFVGAPLWALAALVSGVVGATGYWLLHCSNLALPDSSPSASLIPEAEDGIHPQA